MGKIKEKPGPGRAIRTSPVKGPRKSGDHDQMPSLELANAIDITSKLHQAKDVNIEQQSLNPPKLVLVDRDKKPTKTKRVLKWANRSQPSVHNQQEVTGSTPPPALLPIEMPVPVPVSEETFVPVVKQKEKDTHLKITKSVITTKKSKEIKISKVGQAVVIQEKVKSPEEPFTIYSMYRDMKDIVISDRWCIPEPMWDPQCAREVLLCYELDVLLDGSVRMKRCIKILENFNVVVLLDGTDKTHLFKEKHPTVASVSELCDLIRKVTMVKVCSGIKDCDPTELDNISVKVIERGGSWFSSECNVEVEKGCLGNICRKCTSLRNTLRRKIRRQFGTSEPSTSTPTTPSNNPRLLSNSLKPVLRSVGEALYSNLHHMSGQRYSDEYTIPQPRSGNQILHPTLGIYMNSELKQRLDEIAANPPPLTKIEHVIEFDPRTMTKTVKRIHSPLTSFRNTITSGGRAAKRLKTDGQSFVMGNNGELTLVTTPNGDTIQIPEGYVLADENQWGENVVVQKVSGSDDQFVLGDDNSIIVGSNFTLEDGEEYEVIGEAPSGDDSIQMLPLGNDSNIEIVEVGELDENMITLVDADTQPEIQPVDPSSDIFKFLQAHSRLQA
ncbi:unnamed protein product [Orchesella dallaii]|uniref:Uncharacterized protein n=1 Tax=Orchesella dallaii TaxID=48710 RepID=A0ABP1Q5H1_9HEXA